MDECEKTILVWAGKAVKWTWTPIFVLTRAKVDDWRIVLAFVFCSLRLFLIAPVWRLKRAETAILRSAQG